MSLDLRPLNWDWPKMVAGDTLPATIITESESTTSLSRVRLKIKDADGALFRSLDSDTTGITITSSTAGGWSFTIASMTAPTTEGVYSYDLETIDGAAVIRTEFSGVWEIQQQITD